ncbi:MAG: hypothetical protein DI529_15455 [Chryseobacterium sp.]|nr:MAG: hypothetical protein DI529_15455 [Chryseobacterium sp.]
MKILFILMVVNLISLNAQQLSRENKVLLRTEIEYTEKTFFVYELGEHSIFSILNPKIKKEEVLNFCSLSLYLEYLSKGQKEKKQVSYQEALENISNPELFEEFLNLNKSTLVLTTIY